MTQPQITARTEQEDAPQQHLMLRAGKLSHKEQSPTFHSEMGAGGERDPRRLAEPLTHEERGRPRGLVGTGSGSSQSFLGCPRRRPDPAQQGLGSQGCHLTGWVCCTLMGSRQVLGLPSWQLGAACGREAWRIL